MARAGVRAARVAAQLSVLAAPVAAEDYRCTLTLDCEGRAGCTPRTIDIAFAIDARQFAPPASPDDPPRQKITEVRLDDTTFRAEPFRMENGVRGFWGNGVNQSRMLVIEPDGAARYVELQQGPPFTGFCEASP